MVTGDLRIAQESDPDISCVLTMMKQTPEKPPWEKVALQTHDVCYGACGLGYESTMGFCRGSLRQQMVLP